MRILLINTNDYLGGAARSTYRLYSHLRSVPGVEVRYFVQSAFLRQAEVFKPESKIRRAVAAVRPAISNIPLSLFKKKSPFSLGWLPSFGSLKEQIERFKPDLVHVNWVGDGFLSLSELESIEVPQVWTMHDSWSFTGGCHIPADCTKYNSGCGRCPELQSSFKLDPSYFHWKNKNKLLKRIKPLVVAPSNWLVSKGKNSVLLREASFVRIPNGIDPKVFQVIDQKLAKNLLGIETAKKILTFAAMTATGDSNKGYDLLQGALNSFSPDEKKNHFLIVLGSDQKCISDLFGIETFFAGKVFDELTMSIFLSASDVVCIPSRSENFPNMALESLAVGCPVVAFDVGGLSDLVSHQINGYLAKPFDTQDFAKGLRYCSGNTFVKNEISKEIHGNFSIEKISSDYLKIYEKALSN